MDKYNFASVAAFMKKNDYKVMYQGIEKYRDFIDEYEKNEPANSIVFYKKGSIINYKIGSDNQCVCEIYNKLNKSNLRNDILNIIKDKMVETKILEMVVTSVGLECTIMRFL